MNTTLPLTDRGAYRLWTQDIARYGDTDRLGHLNNAAFSTFLESGRVTVLMQEDAPLAPAGCTFVIVRLELDFRREMHWGGPVEIGTVVLSVGRSSFLLAQGTFQDGVCTATAHTRIVMLDKATRRSAPLPETLRETLESWSSPG
jgi:acyl-CoA thioester hydrolase